MKKKIAWLLSGSTIIILLTVMLDIFNIPSKIGIPMASVNWNVISLIIGNLLVILIALITYLLIDKRNREKDKNQREIALLLLNKTYEQCYESVLLFDNPKIREKAVEKCDFDKVLHEDKQLMYYLEYPFQYHDNIVELSCSGIISQKEFSDYIDVRIAFQKHINIMIMLFDKEDPAMQTRRDFIETYEKVKKSMNEDK